MWYQSQAQPVGGVPVQGDSHADGTPLQAQACRQYIQAMPDNVFEDGWRLPPRKGRCCHHTRQADMRDFFCILATMFGGIVRQKESIPAQLVQDFNKEQGTIDQLIAKHERAIQIQQKTFYILQGFMIHGLITFGMNCLRVMLPGKL